jgi:histone-lysine N-methyltransferase SETD2
MAEPEPEKRTAQLEPELRDMKIEEASFPDEGGDVGGMVQVKAEEDDDLALTPITVPSRPKSTSPSRSSKTSTRSTSSTSSSPGNDEREKIVGGDITLKMEPGKAPKLARTAAHKVVAKPPPLYLDLPDVSQDAKGTFVVIPECNYANKSLGTTDPALECDCSEEWGKLCHLSYRRDPLQTGSC